MCAECDRLNQRLGIDIDLFFRNLEGISLGSNTLNALDRQIICASLLGQERNEIARSISRNSLYIRDRLSNYCYPRIAELMAVDRDRITNKWILILNWLLDPDGDYRLHPPAQLNADNFQASFGRQVFLYPYDRQIGNAQISAARFYQSGLWYQAQRCFLNAWTSGRQIFHSGSPEILIYINNCAIERNHARLSQKKISVRTIAVVVPINHDRGQIATETLQGIAQIQLQINAQIDELGLAEHYPNILPLFGTLLHRKIALKILIVNDINNLYDGDDRTAENLTRLAPELNLIAIIGHYSSEATQRAVPVYAQAGIVLVNSSSTSTQLSSLEIGEQLCFFRIPPIDTINAAKLVEFLADPAAFPHLPALKRTVIIYAENSIYSNSYRQAIEDELNKRSSDFQILSTFGYLNEEDIRSSNYVEQLNREEVDIVIIIIDARIDPNFLANTGLLSQLNLDRCVLAGSATLYKQNFSHSILVPRDSTNADLQPQIITCLPWHWDSRANGCNSNRLPAQGFCTLASRLWDANKVTWRSATAFDSVLLIYQMLQQFPHIDDSRSLLEQMDRHFTLEYHQFQGITGQIAFQANGDRLYPPAEIVKLEWDRSRRRWRWNCISPA
ncbi:ABC transporter substrate-binding protein [Chamaesiphon sp. GL140_3_metabinner_50]|uniref:ABC transporter substrate-binding protein n=1 Tax=Chamaesiphon sp. GL140_3_metabinner_50 TaxID=2970812 RepID=UPI0025F5E84F|nr:ABC transporter substrate-binding protein [Chamaesiphon sp. GL140_3_metabinner_50]